jgi:N4-gp56 family major capsid protein
MATTTTTIASLIPEIVAEAMFVASEASIMRNMVRNYSIPLNAGNIINVPIYPTQTAVALTEGTDITGNAETGLANISTSVATITMGEVGIMTRVTDLARDSAQSDVIADVGRLFGEAIAVKMDKDLTALFDSFTTNVLGNSATQITPADIFKGLAKLRALGVPSQDLFCVLHPEIAYDLKATLTNTFSNPAAGLLQNEAMMSGFVGMIAGIPLFETSNFTAVDAGDWKGGIFHRDALGLAIMKDIRIEVQRDASLRADELVATATYGVAVLREQYGVELAFDSSIA